jgi:hypothetical protein
LARGLSLCEVSLMHLRNAQCCNVDVNTCVKFEGALASPPHERRRAIIRGRPQ